MNRTPHIGHPEYCTRCGIASVKRQRKAEARIRLPKNCGDCRAYFRRHRREKKGTAGKPRPRTDRQQTLFADGIP